MSIVRTDDDNSKQPCLRCGRQVALRSSGTLSGTPVTHKCSHGELCNRSEPNDGSYKAADGTPTLWKPRCSKCTTERSVKQIGVARGTDADAIANERNWRLR